METRAQQGRLNLAREMTGYGRERRLRHVEEYLNVKAVWIRTG